MRIELNVAPDGEVVVARDGQPTPVRQLTWLDGIDQPYPLVWVSRERQYDVELWVAGELIGYVPGPDPEVEAAYEDAEQRSA